jgi:peptide/nickel transport system permease protein
MAQQYRSLPMTVSDTTATVGSAVGRLRRFSRRNPTMVAGISVVLVMTVVAIAAPLLFTGSPKALDPFIRLQAPSSSAWFGTDNLGRDVYTRVIYGSRISLIVGGAVAAITIVAGVIIGLAVGYYRTLDSIVMRVMDGLMSIPSLILALTMVALLGGSVQNVIIALCVVETPRAVRVVRASVLSIRELMFIDAARALGVPTYRILVRHILPNTIAPLIVMATFIAAVSILAESYLSFLGVGAPPEIPSWGNVMAEGRNHISRAVWVIMFPGFFLTLTVLGINLAGDGLRDNLDPRLKTRM